MSCEKGFFEKHLSLLFQYAFISKIFEDTYFIYTLCHDKKSCSLILHNLYNYKSYGIPWLFLSYKYCTHQNLSSGYLHERNAINRHSMKVTPPPKNKSRIWTLPSIRALKLNIYQISILSFNKSHCQSLNIITNWNQST